MGKFAKIPLDTFEGLQLDAGVILRTFNVAEPAASIEGDIICATTGGIEINAVPNYSDMGEDVDNCPNNMKELKKLDYWDCSMTFTGIGVSPEFIKLSLGAADIQGETYALTQDTAIVTGKTYYTRSGSSGNYTYTIVDNPVAGSLSSYYELTRTGKIVPRADLSQNDFTDIWWVGDRADGGMVAVKLLNALSTEGFSLKTEKNNKGQIKTTLTGHVSISAQDVVPIEIYSVAS